MISVVIPAYNEANNIEITLQEIIAHLKSEPFEIIVVDDHSSDNTLEKVENLHHPQIKGIRLSKRSGSNTAIRAGLREAQGEAILCLSADGQDDPATLSAMVQKWKEGCDVVWALRYSRKEEPWHIKVPAQFFYFILKWMSKENLEQVELSRADFYLLDRKAAQAINSCHERNTSLLGLIAWSGFKQGFVEYERRARRSGQSKWNFKSRLNLAEDWIVSFSGFPLKFMIWLGSLIALFGFGYAIFILFFHLKYGHPVEGWASLMIAVLILGGLNLTLLGVIGDYLWRNLEESRKRPLYFIERKIP